MTHFETIKKDLIAGKPVRRSTWSIKDHLIAENDKIFLIAYGAVKFDYRLTPSDLNAKDWEIANV